MVTNVEKLTGFFFFYTTLKIFKHVQPTIQTAHTMPELLVREAESYFNRKLTLQ